MLPRLLSFAITIFAAYFLRCFAFAMFSLRQHIISYLCRLMMIAAIADLPCRCLRLLCLPR